MLVLSRKPGERVFLGDEIVVLVLEVHKNQVRLGIEAPEDVDVFREELTGQWEGRVHSKAK